MTPRTAIPGVGAAVSLGLHGLAAVALFWRPGGGTPAPEPLPGGASVEVVMVSQPHITQGAPQAAQPETEAATATPVPPPAEAGALAVPMPALPPRPQTAMPAVNLGDSDRTADALTVTGDVRSPGPDARFRNMPPGYPKEASRLNQEGTVRLLVHVTPSGEAGLVEVVGSSGSPSLDAAARDAVAQWHFNPAIHDGRPSASIYPLQFHFSRS